MSPLGRRQIRGSQATVVYEKSEALELDPDTSADLIVDNAPADFAIPVQTGRLDFIAQV